MEDLLILPFVGAYMLFLLVIDVAAWAMGHGWGHFSKKRSARKAEKKRLKETFQ